MRNFFSDLSNFFSVSARCARWLQKGNRHYVAGRYERAQVYYQKILRCRPDDLPALCNHANICFFQKKIMAASEAAERLIAGFPKQACGWSLRGRVRLEQGEYAAAEADLRQAVKLAPDDFWNWNYLSQALQKNGRGAEALNAAYRAVELSSGEDSQHLNLAYAIYEITLEKGRETALPTVEKWRRKYGENPIVRQSCGAFFQDRNYTRCDPVYVEKIFDNFASGFDEILASLAYQSPRQIAATVRRRMQVNPAQKYRILDLGCGTGLCGKALDSLFKKRILNGVDLSAPMLEEARRKGVYDRLEKAEIGQYLNNEKTLSDLIVSADVFTYFGTLDKVFVGVFSALKKDSLFVFSATQNNETNDDYFLHPSGRFAHAQNYLKKTLEKCGFRNIVFEDSLLRLEGEKEVRGWIVSAWK